MPTDIIDIVLEYVGVGVEVSCWGCCDGKLFLAPQLTHFIWFQKNFYSCLVCRKYYSRANFYQGKICEWETREEFVSCGKSCFVERTNFPLLCPPSNYNASTMTYRTIACCGHVVVVSLAGSVNYNSSKSVVTHRWKCETCDSFGEDTEKCP